MSKKNYEIIAAHLSFDRRHAKCKDSFDRAVASIALGMKNINPNFNTELFSSAVSDPDYWRGKI